MKNLLLALLIGLSAVACTDRNAPDSYNPQLPPQTQTGANTFGTIINGKVMVPRTPTGYSPPGSQKYGASYTEDDSYLEITAGDGKNTLRGFVFVYLKNISNSMPISVGGYEIEESFGQLSASTSDRTLITVLLYDSKGNIITYGSVEKTGTINIIRSDKNIISGTFSCKLKNTSNPEDIIELKDGRFDFTKQTIFNTYFP